MKRTQGLAACAVFFFAIGVAAAQDSTAGASADTPTGIVGVWTLNTELSDTPEKAMEGGRGDGRRGGAGMPGGMGGRGGGMRGGMGGLGGGRQPNREDMARTRRIMQDAMKPAESLTIVVDGTHASITSGDGRTFSYVADGKKQEQLTGDGELRHKTKWNGAQLVIETEIQDGPKVTRTFAPSGEAQLVLTIKIDGRQAPKPIVVHHFYDRQD